MTPQEQNELILTTLWHQGEALFAHQQQRLTAMVERTELQLNPCCYEEEYGVDWGTMKWSCSALATVFDLITQRETCLKHFGQVDGD